ncbi:hypothetical protein GCM10011309_12280 [Litorimonas cladophorae]|uniref:Type II secretion system protein GspC N-terminal domain-containing protein n=1 Tax=Litorimonas cladophorae TaxID=1220491 RepID=A0A918NFS3_9PROT|nr:type II secretion system protein N [Litorimonas cladophorae]GGX63797.1 hypothetical protein GCM10011309_12280 [Litorimonas cladophorae]
MQAARIALNTGSAVLVAVLGWLIVRIVLGVASPSSLRTADPIIAPNFGGAALASKRAYDFTSDPFSFGEVAAPLSTEPVEDAPETSLNLKLKGIVSDSSAVFRLADGKDKPVAIGDEVMSGVTLTRTTKTFVILDVNGETQKLTLERVKLDPKGENAVIGRAPVAPVTMPTRAEAEALFSQISLKPQLEILPDRTTRLQGYQITPRSGADLSKYGLRSGDIVTRVGPVLLNANRVNIKELSELISTGAAQDLDVIRDGSSVTIRLGQ